MADSHRNWLIKTLRLAMFWEHLNRKSVPSFLSYFKTLSIGPTPGIEHVTSRIAGKRSTYWASSDTRLCIQLYILFLLISLWHSIWTLLYFWDTPCRPLLHWTSRSYTHFGDWKDSSFCMFKSINTWVESHACTVTEHVCPFLHPL